MYTKATYIVDQNNKPISGAKVKVTHPFDDSGKDTFVSDANGYVEITTSHVLATVIINVNGQTESINIQRLPGKVVFKVNNNTQTYGPSTGINPNANTPLTKRIRVTDEAGNGLPFVNILFGRGAGVETDGNGYANVVVESSTENITISFQAEAKNFTIASLPNVVTFGANALPAVNITTTKPQSFLNQYGVYMALGAVALLLLTQKTANKPLEITL